MLSVIVDGAPVRYYWAGDTQKILARHIPAECRYEFFDPRTCEWVPDAYAVDCIVKGPAVEISEAAALEQVARIKWAAKVASTHGFDVDERGVVAINKK